MNVEKGEEKEKKRMVMKEEGRGQRERRKVDIMQGTRQ